MALPSGEASTGKLVFEKRIFRIRGSSEEQKHRQCIKTHHLNHSLSLVLPNCSDVPENILAALQEQHFSVIEQIPLAALVEEDFVEAFGKKGLLYMISIGTQIDTDDCAAVFGVGNLVLNLTKDTYVGLGLEGTLSPHHKKSKAKYVVKIPLSADFFKPGKKYYERVKWCFRKNPHLKFDFLATWRPHLNAISPTSLDRYFESVHHCQIRECRVRATKRHPRRLRVPLIKSSTPQECEESCGHSEFYQWLGAVSLDASCDGAPDDYINTYSTPEPHTTHLNNTVCQFKGFFTPKCIGYILDLIRQLVTRQGSELPWASLTVHGFQDAPVSWQRNDHNFFYEGDNTYTFVVFPDPIYWLYKTHGSHDVII